MKVIKPSYWGKAWDGKLISSGDNWAGKTLIGMDTETTGTDPLNARIVSAAVIMDSPGYDPTILEWVCNPEIDIPLEATAIHGISTETAQKYGRPRAEVISEILNVICQDGPPLVMVNAPFDLTIINAELKRLNMGTLTDWHLPPILDTLCIDRKIDPYRRGRRTLTAVSAAYGITIKGAHQAAGDVLCSLELIRAIARKYPELGKADLDIMQKLQHEAYQEWIIEFEKYRRLDEPDFQIISDWPYVK